MTKLLVCSLFAVLTLSSICLAEDAPFETHTRGPIRSRLALTLGTPAGLNLCGSYWGKKTVGFRMTLGYIPSSGDNYVRGGQLELTLKTHQRGNTITDFSFGMGRCDMEADHQSHQWSYVGAFFNVNSRAFFGQVGLTFGSDKYSRTPGWYGLNGEFKSPQFFAQIGLGLITTRDR